jgi:hypothetical protein
MENVVKFGVVVAILLAVGTFVMFMVPLALANFRKANQVGREPSGDLQSLRSEVDELRSLTPRMAELEERLDFAERLLAQRDAERLPRVRDH